MRELTEKQQSVLDYIVGFVSQEGMAPTIKEISRHFSINPATALYHVVALQRKGYVNRSSKARSLTVLHSEKPRMFSMFLSIPLLGRINAGCPVLSEQNIERHVRIDPGLLPRNCRKEELFALAVQGESMRDAGILEGDIIVARQTDRVSPGDVVVAMAEGETTIKSLHIKDGQWELRPANPDFASRFYPPGGIAVQGVVVMLLRQYR